AAGIRAATVAAVHHASHRQAFGKELAAQPLMANVLADLTLESQAATALAVRLAGAADRAARGAAGGAAPLRLALPAAKYWVCKRFPAHAAEALECLGGNGYVEESGLPRIYREAPLNSIWEGSGNVTSLDVLRALARTEGAAEALLAELGTAAGADASLDEAVAGLRRHLAALAMRTSLGGTHEARRGCARGRRGGRGPLPPRSPTPTARRACTRRRRRAPGHRSARCPPGSTWRRSPTAPVPGLRAGPVDAALAGNPLPAGRHLG